MSYINIENQAKPGIRGVAVVDNSLIISTMIGATPTPNARE